METNALWSNEEFCEKVNDAKSTAEIIQLFAQEGVTVTEEQVLTAKASEKEGELTESVLDSVAGGCIFCRVGGWFVYAVVRAGGGSKQEAREKKQSFRDAFHR